MKPFDVYPLFDIEPVKAAGSWLWDKSGNKYLDFYGGHAVISVGHAHPHYTARLKSQLEKISFYSNAVQNSLQEELAEKLGRFSGYPDYSLFLCNSGAEANENALKLASFRNGRKKIIAFGNSFHGRTSAAVAATHDPSITTSINRQHEVKFLPFDDEALAAMNIGSDVCAVIIEGIQGVGGIREPAATFLKKLRELCDRHQAVLILDEVQSGYGRTGKFFAHQFAEIGPDLITVAKGMGNGFPIGGVLISPAFEAKHGLLGTTFGGNHLACAAGLAVLEIMEKEKLVEHAQQTGETLMEKIRSIDGIKEVRGKGLMIGLETEAPAALVRKTLLEKYRIFTGSSGDKKTIRLLPPLNTGKTEVDYFLSALSAVTASQLIQK
ncbi:MAG: acetylornithine aminotransferase [Bacteroidetes bacterium]|nr:MAG: acetylornithine aminotransferase [Bacteroidota bacterium]